MTTDANETSPASVTEILWCPECQHQSAAPAGHCGRCGVCLSSSAVVVPGSLWGTGQIYRNAIEHPRSPVVVAGVWVLGMAVVAGGGAALSGGLANPGFATLAGAVIGAVAVMGAAALVAKATRNYVLAGQPRATSANAQRQAK